MSEEICPTCGLPKSLCVCKVIEREAKAVKIYTTMRKFGKPATMYSKISDVSDGALSNRITGKLSVLICSL